VNVRLAVFSQNETVLSLVGDFAKGLGCAVDQPHSVSADCLGIELSDAGDVLLELLDYIALSATKAGIEPTEPLCRVAYRRRGALAQVTLDLRIAGITLAR
jgi:hypothetical protein